MSDSGAARGVAPITFIAVTLALNIITVAGARVLQAGLDAQGFVRFRGGPIQNNTGAIVNLGVTIATVDASLVPTLTQVTFVAAGPPALRVLNVLLTGELQLAAGGTTWGVAAVMALEGCSYFRAM